MGILDRRWLWRAGAVLICALVIGGIAAQREQAVSEQSSACARFEAQAELRLDAVVGNGPRTVVIGDSWAAGLESRDIGRTWTDQLPGRVTVHAFAGSGFSRTASGCGEAFSYAARAASAPFDEAALVVIEGGLNDFDRPASEITVGFNAVIDQMVARGVESEEIRVIGPARAPSRAGGAIRVDRLLADLAERRDIAYVSVIDLELDYLDDQLHLTDAGHAMFGSVVQERLGVG
ncbi:MAG TPA: SGNH/GDSL hydrolase family protein [Nocardioides sp.]